MSDTESEEITDFIPRKEQELIDLAHSLAGGLRDVWHEYELEEEYKRSMGILYREMRRLRVVLPGVLAILNTAADQQEMKIYQYYQNEGGW